MSGQMAGSWISGTPSAILRQQESSRRYYQRPDATYVHVDPTLESLSAWSGSARVSINSGPYIVHGDTWATSPGFEVNDLGFQNRADAVGFQSGFTWRKLSPDQLSRDATLNDQDLVLGLRPPARAVLCLGLRWGCGRASIRGILTGGVWLQGLYPSYRHEISGTPWRRSWLMACVRSCDSGWRGSARGPPMVTSGRWCPTRPGERDVHARNREVSREFFPGGRPTRHSACLAAAGESPIPTAGVLPPALLGPLERLVSTGHVAYVDHRSHDMKAVILGGGVGT